MCLAIPMQVVSKQGDQGVVRQGSLSCPVSLVLVPEVGVGDYVLVHAGLAIEQLDWERARETLQLIQQMLQSQSESAP